MTLTDVIVSAVIVAIAALLTVVPLIYGKIKKLKVIKPVEYMPPDGMSPIDMLIEYYGASAEPHEIFNPLMLYWAERGFITIEEDCKRGLILTKVTDLEPPANHDPETFEIERELFDYIFLGKTTTFYTLAAYGSFKDKFIELAGKCKEKAKKITAEKSKKFAYLSVASSLFMFAIVALTVGLSVNNNLLIMALFPFFAIVMSKLFFSMGDFPKGTGLRMLLYPFFSMFGLIPFMVLLMSLPVEAAIIMACAAVVCVANVHFVSLKIDVRSNEQIKTYAKICGFKKFLLRAELAQLEALVEEDPQYYYNILPYCYVLKITQKLKPKFDRIALDGPAWYLGELRDVLMF